MMWDYLARLMEAVAVLLCVLVGVLGLIGIGVVVLIIRELRRDDSVEGRQARKRSEVEELERVFAMEWEESE